MRFAIPSISSTLVLSIAACSGGAGQASSLRGGPDGIPSSSTDSPGNGYEPPGNSGQDNPGNSNQDSPGGASASATCLTCSGVYACAVPNQDAGTELIGLAPGTNGCDAIATQGGSSTGTLACGGAITFPNDTSGAVETWTGNNASFSITATQSGATLTITCTATSQSLPSSTGDSTDFDAG